MRAKPERDHFSIYEPAHSLRRAFQKDRIPLLQMEHLRQLDFMISRGLSYEKTVRTFLQQLYFNESLCPLKTRPDMVILLDTAGALIREGGIWSLLFTAAREEQQTLAGNADLFLVYADMVERANAGKMCDIHLPVPSERALLNRTGRFSILDTYAMHYPGGYLAMAKKVVVEGPSELYANIPVLRCGALTSVDVDEIESYNTIRLLMEDYLLQYDNRNGAALQPLSVAVFGAPGAGKSFGIRQIATSLSRFATTTLNCSQFRNPEALFAALHDALTKTPKGQIPLLFFDEFDSDLAGTDLGWLRYFLAPMQDGEYTLKGRTQSIESAVFVFAGGTKEAFQSFVPSDEEGSAHFRLRKGPDFVSRLKGTLDIKGPNPVSITDRRHLIRRALLLRDLIIRRSPAIYNSRTGTVNISPALLSALLRVSSYRHGSRSLEFILAMSRLFGEKRFTPAYLPPEEQLDIHLDVRDFENKILFEQLIGDGMETFTRRLYENAMPLIDYTRKEAADQAEDVPVSGGQKAPDWDLIGEVNREYYRTIIRALFEKLQDPHNPLGVRRMIPDAPDTLTRPGEKDLEQLSVWTHEAFVTAHLQHGWQYNPFSDPELLRSSYLVPWEELPKDRKEKIRNDLLNHSRYIRTLGFELFHRPYDVQSTP